ncbi:unnamed protein product [Zymoseptoria tritici ST99CH_3D7]|uniref:Protein disulfide-isomerase n=1 Tax=Zymoseptoria tritici (strain ST99CH_3D7) TaxID=1276538 RepID=A0A1X7S6C1_ZYMT9|nr:unnamed protein product [Zymoseptoria tritici ST99CH_3D7]
MRYSLGLMGLAALAAASDVADLNKDTFPAFIKDNDLVLAEFFAPWCGHCKALAPEYEEAATTLKEKNIALAKVDCTEHQDLCQEYGVEGYPTLKIFRGADNVAPYSGPRKAQAIVSYMTKQQLPAVSELTTSTALDEFKTADKIVIVGYFAADDKKSNATFNEVAEAHRDSYLFGATSDVALAEAEGAVQPSIVLYKTFDEGKNTFAEKFDKKAIEEWAKTSATPLIGEVGPETYSDYMAADIPLAYIFAETPEEREEFAKDLKPVAEAYKGKINFATIDAGSFGQHASNLNLAVGTWPAFAIQDITNNKKYPYADAGSAKKLSAKNIGKFVKDFVAGKIEPSIKSEPIPEKQEGVHVVVAKNYQEVVIDSKQDVLLEFYAPWCGHCKSLAPKYDELAGLYKPHLDKIIIAKVDATANDVPDEIQGFPTIKLFKAGSKDAPIDYDGDRSIADLSKFIKENGSSGVYVEYIEPEVSDPVDTEGMPAQAAAATEKAKEGVKEKVKEAAQAAYEAVTGDEDLDEHDEL